MRKVKLWGAFLLVLNFVTITALGVLYYQQPKFVVFDIKTVTDTFLRQVAELNVSEDKGKRLVVRYERTLNAVIDDYTRENTIVLVKSAAVSDLDDKTNEIKREIARRMRENTDFDETGIR